MWFRSVLLKLYMYFVVVVVVVCTLRTILPTHSLELLLLLWWLLLFVCLIGLCIILFFWNCRLMNICRRSICCFFFGWGSEGADDELIVFVHEFSKIREWWMIVTDVLIWKFGFVIWFPRLIRTERRRDFFLVGLFVDFVYGFE